jgi:hypothetical protein
MKKVFFGVGVEPLLVIGYVAEVEDDIGPVFVS